MSARVVATTQLLIDVLTITAEKSRNVGPGATPSEMRLLRFFLPLVQEISEINREARAEMGASVIKVLET